MAEEFTANFSIEDNQQTANFSIQNDNSINANFTIIPTEKDHDKLYNRDKTDQHPISAITDLEGRLEALENQDKNFVFEQAIASDTWTIEHNLDKFPSITVVDSAGTMQLPDDIIYVSTSEITVKFISAFAGTAYLN